MLSLFLLACVEQEIDKVDGFISLHPSITETFFALGVEEQLKGRSEYCLYPESAQTLPTFGTAITPNFEQLASANVTHIVGDQSLEQHKQALTQLATTSPLPWLSVSEMANSIEILGELTNSQSKAKQIVEALQTTFQKQSHQDEVLLLLSGSNVSKGQLWYIKPESIHGSMLEASGFSNAIPLGKNIPQMGIEELLTLDPPTIAIVGDTNIPISELELLRTDIQALSSLQAVVSEHVCLLHLPNAFGTGPSILTTIPLMKEQLTTCLQK